MSAAFRLPELPLPPGTDPSDYPIPGRLNAALCAVGFAGALGLLWLGSARPEWWWGLGVGVAFSYWMLFVYALIHQAQHDTLHGDARWNYRLGALLSLLFPAPFTLIRTTHQGHHLRNRTDFELFDQYYPTDNRFLKTAQFYSILCGLFWPIIPVGGLLAAISPRIFQWQVFQRGRNTGYLLGDLRAEDVPALRGEMLAIVALFAALFFLLRPGHVALAYACFAVNWSTRQYVSHAFTRRDILEGALNLRTGTLMSWLLLRGEWDLNHHRYPMVPWNYLPALPSAPDERVDYLPQYWRQWLGPRPCTEPAPEALAPVQLTLRD